MYTSKITGNNSTSVYEHYQKIDSFTGRLNIPQLNVEQQESLEKDLTLEELKDALASFADKKSPGEDGFTKEFYQTFFNLIGKELLNSYNDSFHKGSLSISIKPIAQPQFHRSDVNLKTQLFLSSPQHFTFPSPEVLVPDNDEDLLISPFELSTEWMKLRLLKITD